MNASKRKFNDLLSNFGKKSSSTTNKESNVELTDNQLKRRRISYPTSIPSHTGSHVGSTTDSYLETTSMAHNKSLSLASAGPATTGSPKYAPWDRTAFLKRLESFKSVIDWMPKPAKVNEVEWAKRGWVCRGQERVRCELCSIEIFVKLNFKESDGGDTKVLNPSEIEEALIEKYAELIISSHAETCLWKQRGCDDSIFKLSLNHAPTTLHDIHQRYDALYAIGNRLPYMHNLNPPTEFDLNAVISYLPNNFIKPPMNEFDSATPITSCLINRVALTMALFGWTARPESKFRDGAAVCEVCFRTLGLWLFKSKEINETGEVIHPAVINYLDPVDQHREYCPWKNAKSQSVTSSSHTAATVPEMAAWQVVLRVLKNDYYLRETRKGTKISRSIQDVATDSSGQMDTSLDLGNIASIDEAESIVLREEKDKARWARLRRVKSLFDAKPVKKLLNSSSSVQNARP